jgi:23S rRNA pseudouridine1911/1915/1917 synthase
MEHKEIEKRILFEDHHLLIFNKAAGQPVQSDMSGDISMLDVLKGYIKERDQKPGNVFLGLVHRLDRPVSGTVVLAKSSKALSRLTQMFKDRQVQKIYYAIVWGVPAVEKETLTHYHRKDGERHLAILSLKPSKHTKPAILTYQLMSHVNQHSLLEIYLETGRFHQIRAQLFKIGLPIVGDLKYGAKKPNPDKSVCLHARFLAFKHPVTGHDLTFTAPIPGTLDHWKKFGIRS